MLQGPMQATAGRVQPALAALPAAAGNCAAAAAAARGRLQQRQQRRRPGAAPGSPFTRRSHQQLLPVPHAAAIEVAPAGTVEIESLQYEDGCFTVQGCLMTAASPDVVYQVLTDYDALPRVFHNVESSMVRVCSESGQKQLVQTCKWAFLVFSGTFLNELNVRENPAARQLTFSLVESAFMKEFVGSWDVRRVSDGLTEVRHYLSVRPVVAPPKKIGDLSKKIFKKQVVGILEDLNQELTARQG